MSDHVECLGRIEYELDANGARTGRWRPRGTPTRTWPWRGGRSEASEPVEAKKR
jgi:hypothetical protein